MEEKLTICGPVVYAITQRMPFSTKLTLARQLFVKNSIPNFMKIQQSLIQIDRHGLHIRHSFYLVRNMFKVIYTQVLGQIFISIIFVGVSGKCIVFFLCCLLILLTYNTFLQLLFSCVHHFFLCIPFRNEGQTFHCTLQH